MECRFCSVQISLLRNLKQHEKGCYLNPDRVSHACPNCQKKFARKDALNAHMNNHDRSESPIDFDESDSWYKVVRRNGAEVKSMKACQDAVEVQFTPKGIVEADKNPTRVIGTVINELFDLEEIRSQSKYIQLTLSGDLLDYPIISQFTSSQTFDTNWFLSRIDAVKQSSKIFSSLNTKSNLILTLFCKDGLENK